MATQSPYGSSGLSRPGVLGHAAHGLATLQAWSLDADTSRKQHAMCARGWTLGDACRSGIGDRGLSRFDFWHARTRRTQHCGHSHNCCRRISRGRLPLSEADYSKEGTD